MMAVETIQHQIYTDFCLSLQMRILSQSCIQAIQIIRDTSMTPSPEYLNGPLVLTRKDLYIFFHLQSILSTFYQQLLCQYIIMIDSITRSFCLCHCVQNGPSYPGKETQLTLCIEMPSVQNQHQISRNDKHQLLHRLQSLKTITNLQ